MFLATTAHPEWWDTSDEILVLGSGCLRYDQRAQWSTLRYVMAPNPWGDPDAVKAAAAYCREGIDRMIAELTVMLNQLHGVTWSQRYWRILLGPWLLYYVHALYERYVSLTRAVASAPQLTTTVLDEAAYQPALDTQAFSALAVGAEADGFNLQLYSQVIRGLGWTSRIWKVVRPNGPSPAGQDGSATEPTRTERLVSTLVRAVHPQVMVGPLLGRRDLARLLAALMTRGLALPGPASFRCERQPMDPAMREPLGRLPAWDAFSRVLIQTLPVNFPLTYLEGYRRFRARCLRLWPQPPRVVASMRWFACEPLLFLAAEFGDRGARLVGWQQGGGYGIYDVHPYEQHEVAVTDRWCSFGWAAPQPSGKVTAVPHPRFLSRRRSRRGHGRRRAIVLVTMSLPRYPMRFDSMPVGQFDRILECRQRWIQHLPDACRERLVVRLGPGGFGWCQRRRLMDACGPVQFSDQTTPVQHLFGRAKLVVIEYPATAYLETMAADIPTVCFWEPRYWRIREEAAAYFEDFRRAGILWGSPEAAAAHVEAIHDDPWRWWDSPELQRVRRQFVRRHAWGEPDWLRRWVEVIRAEAVVSERGVVSSPGDTAAAVPLLEEEPVGSR